MAVEERLPRLRLQAVRVVDVAGDLLAARVEVAHEDDARELAVPDELLARGERCGGERDD